MQIKVKRRDYASADMLDVEISVDLILNRIKRYVAAQKWSRVRTAFEARLPHHTTIRHIDDPDWNPTASTIRALEKIVPPDFDPIGAPDRLQD